MRLFKPHELPGTLICVEGIDGSGKSTQLAILRDWLKSKNLDVIFTEWNSSDLISQTTKKAKKKNLLSPRTFSLLHAVDFADRLEQVIIPAMKAGFIVLADRYVYTAFARDVARGVDRDWVRNMYGFAVKPDLALYYSIPAEVSLERICANRAPSFYEAGMDLKLSNNPYKSYVIFQSRVNEEYADMVNEFGLVRIDANNTIHSKQVLLRQYVTELLSKKGIQI
ncbi:TPA: dTMP kinase [Candidatus Gastranaerophilales bacterium HUM_21]|nr:MAG TPA: dTMP kinase [Candidatus Gastranaerophilales bacterium HUM_21]